MEKISVGSYGNWELSRRLGSGGFGEVLLWQHRMTKQEIATKRLIKDASFLGEDEIAKLKQRWHQEFKWMRDLNTEYIVSGVILKDKAFVEYLNTQHAWRPLPIIVMEYCNGGDLRSHLQQLENLNGLHEYEVREVMHALRHAIEYLHNTCRIEHRDLKPDNVVIQKNGRKRLYKLTDFGLARFQTEHTCVKSIVGTRHYYAPEVVTTAEYTKTVDYWSLGVIAFELMCGVLPFIPHQSLGPIIDSIRKKSKQCVAITEHHARPQSFEFQTEIFAETRMSGVFRQRMTEWLRLALDVDYRTRGTASTDVENGGGDGDTVLKLYTELDAIVASKVLTVFCLNTYRFYAYDVSAPELSSMKSLVNALKRDTGLTWLYFVFPVLHPRSDLSKVKHPIDLFVEELADTSDPSNPPVMLYLVGYQCDYNAGDSPAVSPIIRWCQNAEAAEVPQWLLQQYALHTHFLLSSEQRHLVALLDGLQQYALTMENDVVELEPSLQELHTKIAFMHGRVGQFERMIRLAKEVNEQKIPNCGTLFDFWLKRSAEFIGKITKIDLEVGQSIRKRQASARRRIKEENAGNHFEEWSKSDKYKLAEFRQHLLPGQPKAAGAKSHLDYCQDAVFECMKQRNSFLRSKPLQKSRELIEEVHKECIAITEIMKNTRKYLGELESHLELATRDFQTQLLDVRMNGFAIGPQISPFKHSLNSDGSPAVIQVNNELSSAPASIFFELLQLPTEQLVQDALQTIKLLSMDDDDDAMSQIPRTIEFND